MCVRKIVLLGCLLLATPVLAFAQLPSDSLYDLNKVLGNLFQEMLPLCSRLIDVGRALGGFAALWYISTRAWKHLANNEAIDFYPMLKPFAICIALGLYPQVIGLMNAVLDPTVQATKEMSKDNMRAITIGLEEQEKAIMVTPPYTPYPSGDGDTDKYEQPDGTTDPSQQSGSGLRSVFSMFSISGMFKAIALELSQLLCSAASLCINCIRTFYLLILAILGPLVFGLSIFDSFQSSLSSWFSRYINIYMWLPVANLFGAITSKILVNMMEMDQNFFSSTAYIIFLIISIVGYTTVPSIANYIVQSVVGEGNPLMQKINNMGQTAVKAAGAML